MPTWDLLVSFPFEINTKGHKECFSGLSTTFVLGEFFRSLGWGEPWRLVEMYDSGRLSQRKLEQSRFEAACKKGHSWEGWGVFN